jgi:hypothetical protein
MHDDELQNFKAMDTIVKLMFKKLPRIYSLNLYAQVNLLLLWQYMFLSI